MNDTEKITEKEVKATNPTSENEEKVVRSNCGMCYSGCGVFVHLENGRITKIEGDPDCPFDNGTLCPKGLASKQLVYHPD